MEAAPPPLVPLDVLLSRCLRELGQEDRLEATLELLRSEWFTTTADLLAALEDAETWTGLKLPGRLKLSLKRELGKKALPLLNTSHEEEDQQEVAGWVKCFSPEHNSVYYYNELTEETLWSLPAGATVKREDAWSMRLCAPCGDDGAEECEEGTEERADEEEDADAEAEAEAEVEEDMRWQSLSHEANNWYCDVRGLPPVPSAPMLPDTDPIHCVNAYPALPVAVVVSAEADDEDDEDDGQWEGDEEEEEEEEEEEGDEEEDEEEEEEDEESEEEEEMHERREEEGSLGSDEFVLAGLSNSVVPSPTCVRRLVEMGFSECSSKAALKCCLNSLSDAAALLVTRKGRTDTLPPASSLSHRDRLNDASTIDGTSLVTPAAPRSLPPRPPTPPAPPSAEAEGRLSGLFPRLGSKVRGFLSNKSPTP